jgi:hypothetical protein
LKPIGKLVEHGPPIIGQAAQAVNAGEAGGLLDPFADAKSAAQGHPYASPSLMAGVLRG